MAKPQRIAVDLQDLLKDLSPKALKGLVSAPLGYRTDRLIQAAQAHNPKLGTVRPAEFVSALLHATEQNGPVLSQMIDNYRTARVWQTRQSLGEQTATTGKWYVKIRGQGQRA
jgi:hypothetical protein